MLACVCVGVRFLHTTPLIAWLNHEFIQNTCMLSTNIYAHVHAYMSHICMRPARIFFLRLWRRLWSLRRPPSHWMSRTHHDTLSGRESDRSNISGDFGPRRHMRADLATLAGKRLIAMCYWRTNLCRSSSYHWDRSRFDEIMGARHCAEISGINSLHIIQNGSHHTPHTTPS